MADSLRPLPPKPETRLPTTRHSNQIGRPALRTRLAPLTPATVAMAALAMFVAIVMGASGSGAQAAGPAGLGAPEGFGAPTTGGDGGPLYWVTNVNNDGPGSLRRGAEDDRPLLIRFRASGTIALQRHLKVGANKTIDGRGADVTISGRGFVLAKPNVIVTNLKFSDFGDPAKEDNPEDAILINGASRVWIDHCTITGAADKAIGIPVGTDVTLSWNRFVEQDQVVQIGTFATRDRSGDTRVTMHHNLFDGDGYRMPRVSYAKVHVYNSYLRNWTVHGMSAVRGSQLLSQANIFEAGAKDNAIIFSGGDPEKDASPGFVRSEGEMLLNGSQIRENDPALVFLPSSYYQVNVEPATEELRQRLVTETGWRVTPMPPDPPGSPSPESPDSSSSGSWWYLISPGGAVVVVVVTVLLVRWRRRTSGGSSSGPPSSTDALQPLGR